MPYLRSQVAVTLGPLLNLDLFKRGWYHISCSIADSDSPETQSTVTCLKLLESGHAECDYPDACALKDHFLTQTVMIEYSAQSYALGETFIFELVTPFRRDYTEAYVPAHLQLTLQLMFRPEEELPADPAHFELVSTRHLSVTVDWRKGLHDHWPVIFDYFHLCALGVTLHTSLCEVSPDNLSIMTPQDPPVPTGRLSWLFSQPSPPPPLVSFHDMLFGCPSQKATGRSVFYHFPTQQINRASHAHRMLADILSTACDNLKASCSLVSDGMDSEAPTVTRTLELSDTHTKEEVEREYRQHVASLGDRLTSTWEWFLKNAAAYPDTTGVLANRCHKNRLLGLNMSVVLSNSNIDPSHIGPRAATIRRTLPISLPLLSIENMEGSHNAAVVFVEQCPWSLQQPYTPQPRLAFQQEISPYLVSSLPSPSSHRSPAHLVVCVHGLQGNQYDLRLYRIFLQLALPKHNIIFLMSQSNQGNTFTDFNSMTDRLQEELLEFLKDIPTPSKISFIAHSLGGIVVRSLLTRPSIVHILPRLHLLISICGPHLGTQAQTGIISAGMWVVRKWYQSTSLLQLSIKDAAEPCNCFLYHLSEAPTFDYFKHVVLISSPQDKYVPQVSAQLLAGRMSDNTTEVMCANLLRGMKRNQVDLVRITVHHQLLTSADSMIGRAAHIAMLDNELLIEKLVLCHCVKYFV